MKDRYGTIYRGKQTLLDHDTGELIEVDKIYRKQVEGNFVKAYIKGLVMMLDVVGGGKLKVVNYLLDNLRLSDNKLVATTREIAETTGVSTKTVTETLKMLRKGNIIKRRTGVLMLNPQILLRGDDEKHKYLLVEFEQFDRDNEDEHAYDEYQSFEQEKEL
ncbi:MULTISPECIES: replication/maintenance protein RepL [Actinomycetes]